jgi:hypothetical protein
MYGRFDENALPLLGAPAVVLRRNLSPAMTDLCIQLFKNMGSCEQQLKFQPFAACAAPKKQSFKLLAPEATS